MKTLMEDYCFNILYEEVKTGLAASTIGGGLIGLGSYILYKKYKQAKMKAAMEKDPSKKNELNAKANQLQQDANKKKVESQKKERLQKQQERMQKQLQQNQQNKQQQMG